MKRYRPIALRRVPHLLIQITVHVVLRSPCDLNNRRFGRNSLRRHQSLPSVSVAFRTILLCFLRTQTITYTRSQPELILLSLSYYPPSFLLLVQDLFSHFPRTSPRSAQFASRFRDLRYPKQRCHQASTPRAIQCRKTLHFWRPASEELPQGTSSKQRSQGASLDITASPS